MIKALVIIIYILLLVTKTHAHEKNDELFISCKGKIPINSFSNNNTETLIKLDLKQSKIIFTTGYEYISPKKWGAKNIDFEFYTGTRTDTKLKKMDHQEHFFINRFTGDGSFFYSKTKESNWKLLEKTYKVKCKKVERVF